MKRDDANWVTLAAVTTLMVQGMFLAATDCGDQVPHITNFTEDHDIPRLQLTRDDLLAAIRTNRAHYQAG